MIGDVGCSEPKTPESFWKGINERMAENIFRE